MSKNLYAVVMAGGSGTRFWPESRKLRPKQLLPLAGDGTTPLLAATAKRVRSLVDAARTVVVTNAALERATREALPELSRESFLFEPVGRNTAPCVAWATAWVSRRDPKGVLVVLPADAFIENEAAFVDALKRAAVAAEAGGVVTLGIRPTRPETGYGYLHVGRATEYAGVQRVQAFVEKPDPATAEKYVRGGEHLWNAGIFVFRADVMLTAFAKHLPAVHDAMARLDAAAAAGREDEEARAVYPLMPNVSIDYGIMEKIDDVCVVPADCGWSDVGSWQASWELGRRDGHGNVVRVEASRAVVIDAMNNLVVAPAGKTVAVIGVDDLVVVDTPDALLIVPRSRAQDVKRAVDELSRRGRTDVL